MTTDKKTKIGIIGCGNISKAYLLNLTRFNNTEVAACSDLIIDRARAKAEEFHVPKACTVEELLQDPEIEIVVNLTIPQVHAEVARSALKAGKHVYGEKPLGMNRAEGGAIMKMAKAKSRRVGSAPDTFLGGGHQTCRKIIDDGLIGRPIGATAFMMSRGHESWHPEPDYYYQPGAGPMFDMGPYYLTALVNMMGPVRRLTAVTQKTFAQRKITSQPNFGKVIKVNVPTYVAGLLEFAGGAVGTIITTFDVWYSELPRIEVYGTEGSMSVPDPNGFGGKVRVRGRDDKEWKEIPLTHGYEKNARGVGVADMAAAIRSGRAHRASGEVAFHVLDIMQALHESAASGRHIVLKSTCKKPSALPTGLKQWKIDN
jgi:predicted dehydrogenase